MSKNSEIAEIFSNISDMLNVLGENPFKVRAYRNAAENILDLSEDVEDVAARGELTEIQGVGKDLAEKIDA
jgi:DNA polymerase (family 10)